MNKIKALFVLFIVLWGATAFSMDSDVGVAVQLSNVCRSFNTIYYYEFIKAPIGSSCQFMVDGIFYVGTIVEK